MKSSRLWEYVRNRRERLKQDEEIRLSTMLNSVESFEETSQPSKIEDKNTEYNMNNMKNDDNEVPPKTDLNMNPLNLSVGDIDDVSKLLNHPKLKDSHILEEEIARELSNDPNYFRNLLKTFQEQSSDNAEGSHESFESFLNKRVYELLQTGKQRQKEKQKSLEYLNMFLDDNYSQSKGRPMISPDKLLTIAKEEIFQHKVLSIFNGYESFFEDPFDLGLEPSLKPYVPYHFKDVIFQPNSSSTTTTTTASSSKADEIDKFLKKK